MSLQIDPDQSLLHLLVLESSIPLFHQRREVKNLNWMFLLIANAQKLLEVNAKAPMCHPLLTHRRKSDIKDFQSLRCSIFKKCYRTSRVQQLIKKVTQGICHRSGEREMELNSNHIPCSASTTLILVHILTVPWLASMAIFRGHPNNYNISF